MFVDVEVTGSSPEQVAEVHRFASLLRVPADPADGAAMAQWQLDRSHVQAVLDGVSLAATAAFESSLVWARDGARSAGSWLAANTATSKVSADVRLKTSRLAAGMTHVQAAARRGDLGADKVHHLVRARTKDNADAFDADEAWLVRTLVPLRTEAARAQLEAWKLGVLEREGRNEPDGPAPTPDSDLDRVNLSGGFQGRGLLDADLTPPTLAMVSGGLDAEIDRWFREGSLHDDARTRSELQGAAFADIFRRGLGQTDQHGAPRPLVLAIVDADTLAGRTREHGGSTAVAPLGPWPDGSHGNDRSADRSDARPDSDTCSGSGSPSGTWPDPATGLGAGPGPEAEPGSDSGSGSWSGPDAGRGFGRDPGSGYGSGRSRSSADEASNQPTGRRPDWECGRDLAVDVFRRRSEIVGVGPVPIETIRRLLCEGDVARVVTDGRGRPIDVGRTQRCFTAAQWKALVVRSGGRCEWPGCDVAHERCQAHHLHPWEHGGPTDLANALVTCNHHHHLVHEGGFTARRTADGAIEVRRPDGTLVTTQLHHAA